MILWLQNWNYEVTKCYEYLELFFHLDFSDHWEMIHWDDSPILTIKTTMRAASVKHRPTSPPSVATVTRDCISRSWRGCISGVSEVLAAWGFGGNHGKPDNQWIGLRENLQGTMVFTIKYIRYRVFRLKLSHHPSLWNNEPSQIRLHQF